MDFRLRILDVRLDYNPACIIPFMLRQLRITNYLLLFTFFIFLLSCTVQPQPSTQTIFYAYRIDPPAFVDFSDDFQQVDEIPFSIPPNCGLFDVFPAPVGGYLLIELSCPNGQTVLFLDTSSSPGNGPEAGTVTQPITDSDSHFLAWTSDGKSAYLKVDSLGNTRIVRVYTDGKRQDTDIIGWAYDLSSKPGSDDFVFTFSRGLGSGSELTSVQQAGRDLQQLYVDRHHYISFARYSPDGTQIAFIKIPDTQTPFTVGELWVINADGSNPRKLADADAGHGYAANWSPDGTRIAFVKRENPEDESANQSSDSLISNIYYVNVAGGELTQVTSLMEGYVETPHWSPEGNTLAFTVVLNGRMKVQIAEIDSGQIRSLITESTCCPAWMRK